MSKDVPRSKLGDQAKNETVKVPLSTTVGAALKLAGGRWIVVLRADHKPFAAIKPTILARMPRRRTLESVLPELPPTIVAPAGTPMADLLASELFRELAPDSPIISTNKAGPAHVLAGPSVKSLLRAHDLQATIGDDELLGRPHVPQLSKVCQYSEGRACEAIRQFRRRPLRMPPCTNPNSLTPHAFVW